MPKQHYRPATFTARDSVGYLLKHAHRMIVERADQQLSNSHFTFQQGIVLVLIRDGIAITPAELCRETRHDSGAMTRLIDQLEERGLIGRQRSREDRRVVELRLTAAGQRAAKLLIETLVECLNAALAAFSEEEVAVFKNLLRKLIFTLGGPANDPVAQSMKSS